MHTPGARRFCARVLRHQRPRCGITASDPSASWASLAFSCSLVPMWTARWLCRSPAGSSRASPVVGMQRWPATQARGHLPLTLRPSPRPPPQASAPRPTTSPRDSRSGGGWSSPCSCLAAWSRASATCGSEQTDSPASAGWPCCTSCSSACGSGKLDGTCVHEGSSCTSVLPPGTTELALPSGRRGPRGSEHTSVQHRLGCGAWLAMSALKLRCEKQPSGSRGPFLP